MGHGLGVGPVASDRFGTDLQPAHFHGDLVRQIADAVVRLNESKSSIPFSSAMKPTFCLIPRWSSSRCC
jgi:hypothetical protein